MRKYNILYSFLAICMQLVPSLLWGQSPNDSISAISLVDSIVVSSQGDTIYYFKRSIFDFGETYKARSQGSTFLSDPIPVAKSVQNATFMVEDNIDRTKYVGQIPYTHSVTPTGGKAYTVPIEIAKTNGVSPQLTINYNSQSGNGLLGFGWNLGGLSAITIITKNIYFDNEVAAPTSDNPNIAFALDGVRLVASQKMSEYPLETAQGQILVQPVYSTKYISAIQYFRVLYPNGTKAIFGFDNNKGETEYTYPIASLEDIKGYRIDFEYTGSLQSTTVVSKIKYGSRDANSHPSCIEFEYMKRNDIPQTFILGHPIQLDKLLTKIKSYNDNEELRTYTLTYSLEDVYQLMKIDCSVGSSFLNPLKFRYGEDQDVVAPDELIKGDQILLSSYFTSSGMVYQRGRFYKNDYNEGLVIYPKFSNYTCLITDKSLGVTHYQYGSGYSPEQAILVAPKLSFLSDVQTIYAGEGFQQLSCADVDGDGIEEFVQLNIVGFYSNGYSALKVTTHRCTPTGFSSADKMYAVDGLVVDGAYTSTIARSYYFGDFNGDGKIELLTISYNSTFKGEQRTSIFTVIDLASGNILSSSPCFSYGVENAAYVYILDYDGDGKSDICHIGTNDTNIYSLAKQSEESFLFQRICSTNTLKEYNVKGREVQITDYNADGKQDFVVLPKQSTYFDRYLRVYEFDQGCEGGYQLMEPGHPAYMILHENYRENRYRIMVCSTNADSYYVEDTEQYEEILSTDKGDLWEVYLSRGEDSFNYRSMHLIRTKEFADYVVMDVDRDGFPDMLQSDSKAVSVYLQKGEVWESTPCATENTFAFTPKLLPVNLYNYGNPTDILLIDNETAISCSFNKDRGKSRLLTSLTDSYGLLHSNHYTEMTSREVYVPGNINRAYPYNNFIAPLNLIERASIYNPVDFCNVFQERYKYTGAVLHRTGLGFCGFTKTDVNDEMRGYITVDEKDPEMFGISVHTTSPLIERSCVYQNNTVGKCSNLLIKSLTEFDKLKGNTITKSYEYDSFCNIVRETVNFDPTINTVTTQTYNNVMTQERYMLGIPLIKEVTRTRDSDSWVESEEISYHPNWLPKQKLLKVENSQVNKTEWTYDLCGNILFERSTPYNATGSTYTTYIYGLANRYPNEIQDILGRETYYLSYNKYGTPTVTRDFNQHQTYYSFDDFGRVQSVIYPTGTTSTTYAWETVLGLYSVTQETSGKPTQKTYYDILDREVQVATQRFDGSWQYIRKEYDRFGCLSKVSQPFKDGGTIHWTTYGYDDYNRPTSVTEASGKSITNSYSGNSVTVRENNIAKTSVFDKSGLLVTVTDPAGTITYTYRADGQLKEVIAPGDIITSFGYDSYGRRNKIVDPSGGTQTTVESYDGNEYTITQTDANNKTIITEYDLCGRILSKTRPEFNTSYSYDSYVHEIKDIYSTNQVSKEYEYNSSVRLIQEKETAPDGVWLQRNYTYTSGNNIAKIVYQSSRDGSIATEDRIYTNGYLTEIKLNNTSVWKLIEENDMGQPIKVATGPLTRTYGYDDYGIPTTRKVGDLQHFSYSFHPQTGNLLSRTDETRHITEQFAYDDLNRLIEYGDKAVDYDIKGNITNMSKIGNMSYAHPSKPYAVTDIAFTSDLVLRNGQEVFYSSFQRPTSITAPAYTQDDLSLIVPSISIKFTYDENGERMKRECIIQNRRTLRYYFGDCYETEGTSTNSTNSFLYIGGDAYSAPIAYVKKNGSWDINYICRDYIGSITHLTNSSGELLQELSYDAWGRLRNPVNQIVYALGGGEPIPVLGRGYTGHEHLPISGLINMNARLYDPALGRFLSPDPYVQAPEKSQNFNRYSYCLNNPLAYTDENGEFILAAVVGFWKGVFTKQNPFKTAWKSVTNEAKIYGGLFIADKNKNFLEKSWEIISRFTYQLPQTVVGEFFSLGKNVIGLVDDVHFYRGATYLINENASKHNGVTIGSYININDRELTPKNEEGKFDPTMKDLYMHEYGHYLQSQEYGWAYLINVGVPSIISAKNSERIIDGDYAGLTTHRMEWYEKRANKKANSYFKEHSGRIWNIKEYPM